MDAAWVRVEREISHVAGQTAEEAEHRSLSRARALLHYHAQQSLNPAYRELLDDARVDPAAWHHVPIIDKEWLARAGYYGQGQGVTGSSVSMTWLARHCGDNALVTAATTPLDEQLRRAVAFGPDTISGSPGFLQQIARTAAGLHPVLMVYGGAALAGIDADRLRARFPGARLTAFYPTTEAGALGTAPGDDGVYRTFSETHLIEIVDTDGHPVAVGARGDVVVTQFDARAAPIIRYRVGDRATYRGWEQGRLLLSDIERSAEAAIGSTLVPYSDLRTWAPRLAALGHPVVAVQLVRACSPGEAREKPIVRVIGPAAGTEPADTELAAAALALLDDFPQIASEIASGELGPARAEFRDPPVSLAGPWKIPLYVDERTLAEDPCPGD